jgi:multicomponent Na+:H+ antiporter subunit D
MMYLPVVVLAMMSLLIGVFAEPIMLVMNQIGDQLMTPSGYIEAVLGASASAEAALLDPIEIQAERVDDRLEETP